jgi:hypothetical protein
LESIGSGSLPEDWEIDLSWRNPETKKGRSANWQEGEFMEVVQSSSKGFTTVLKRILRQSLAKARREPLPRAKGKRRVFLGRSLANRKGWETRWKAGRSLGPKGRAFLERESERE